MYVQCNAHKFWSETLLHAILAECVAKQALNKQFYLMN